MDHKAPFLSYQSPIKSAEVLTQEVGEIVLTWIAQVNLMSSQKFIRVGPSLYLEGRPPMITRVGTSPALKISWTCYKSAKK